MIKGIYSKRRHLKTEGEFRECKKLGREV